MLVSVQVRERLQWGCAWSFVLAVGYLSLWQGATWDEPWLFQRAHALLLGQPLDPFKPLAGLMLLPVVMLKGEYLGGRILFLFVQGLLGFGLWRLLPKKWPASLRMLAAVGLWLEPTFRERVLELRTDTLALAILLLATHVLGTRPLWLSKSTTWVWASLLVLGLALSPKLAIWGVPWIPAALLASAPELPRKQVWQRLARLGLAMAAISSLGLIIVACLHPVAIRGVLAATATPFASGVTFFPPAVRQYLPQVLCTGWPFWVLALMGLPGIPTALRARDIREALLLHWELTGWAAFLATLWYPGAFPYHFVGVAAGLWPSALRGVENVRRWWGVRGTVIVGALSVGTLLFALGPVLRGPSLFQQVALMNTAHAFLGPGRSYVDGVGWYPEPQAAPFVTAQGVSAGIGRSLWREWEKDGLALLVLNGRSEQLLDKANTDWLQQNMVKIHPQLLVPGKVVRGGGQAVVWQVRVPGRYRCETARALAWSLDGIEMPRGDIGLELQAGLHHVCVAGGPDAVLACYLAPRGSDTVPSAFSPFFLPFQR